MPKMFNLEEFQPYAEKIDGRDLIIPAEQYGVKLLSVGFFVDPNSATIWRGSMAGSALKQLIGDADWGELDYFLIDMPPGTSDVPLTVFQKLPVDAAVVVTSPQELVAQIVEKAVKMASMMNIPVLGVVENMSYLPCPHCGERIYPFGEPSSDVAAAFNIPIYESLPLDPKLASLCDAGSIEDYEGELLHSLSVAIHALD